MRHLKKIGLAAGVATVIGVSAGVVVAQSPSDVVNQGPMCQTFNHPYCIHVTSPIHLGEQIKLGRAPGRTIAWRGCTANGCQGVLFIQGSHPLMVIRRADTGKMVVGGELDAGTAWIRHNATGIMYQNRRHRGWFITGSNTLNSNLLSCPRPCPVKPSIQQWNGPL